VKTSGTDLAVLRDTDGNYYVRVPDDQVAQLESVTGGEMSGYLLPAVQQVYATPLRLSGFQVSFVPKSPLRPLNPWLV
jgi:hypothetical protein